MCAIVRPAWQSVALPAGKHSENSSKLPTCTLHFSDGFPKGCQQRAIKFVAYVLVSCWRQWVAQPWLLAKSHSCTACSSISRVWTGCIFHTLLMLIPIMRRPLAGKNLHLHTLHAFNYLHVESQLPKQLLRVLQLCCVLWQIYEVRPVGHLRMLPTLALPPAVLVPCLHALVCSCVC